MSIFLSRTLYVYTTISMAFGCLQNDLRQQQQQQRQQQRRQRQLQHDQEKQYQIKPWIFSRLRADADSG